jgi:hypothetical protein
MFKSTITVFTKIAGSSFIILLILGTLGTVGAEAQCPNMPPPKVERVDFKGNVAVSVDHQTDTKNEAPLSIKEYGENNEVEWQLSSMPGNIKNWPVVYPRETAGVETKPELEARFELEAVTKKFLETEIEGAAEILGELTLGASTLKFEKKFANAAEVATQVKGLGYLSTEAVKSTTPLPQSVLLYENAPIAWTMAGTEIKGKKAFLFQMGKSTHNFYVTNAPAIGGITNYLTLLDLDTKGIEKEATKQPPSETEVIKGIWSEFKTRNIGFRWYEIGPGTIHRGGSTLEYYEENDTVGDTLKQIKEANIPACTVGGVEGLLRQAEGQCGAWALAMSYALALEGVSSVTLEVVAKFGAAGEPCEAAKACNMLIKDWEFVGAGGGGKFPYPATDVNDLAGLPGQGTANPPAVFGNHFIVEAGKGSGKLYDPSYGTGPFEGAEPLKEFQKNSIEGFCEAFVGNETKCQVAPAALQLVSTVSNKFG